MQPDSRRLLPVRSPRARRERSLAGRLIGDAPGEWSEVPWISDELEGWEDLSEEEQERVRALLGEELPDDDDDYYE